MIKRYVVASIVGMTFGLLLLISQGVLANYYVGMGFEQNAWHIPYWNFPDVRAPKGFESLRDQAAFLRTCHLFIEHGFTFLALPAFGLCGLIKLTDVFKNNRALKCFVRTMWIIACSFPPLCAEGFLLAIFSPHNTIRDMFYGCISGFCLSFWFCVCAAVLVGPIILLVLLDQEFRWLDRIMRNAGKLVRRERYRPWCT